MKNEREPTKKFPLKHFAAGAGLAGGDFFVNHGIEVAVVAEASTFGFMNPMIDGHPIAALITTMAVGTAVSILNSIQNTRLNHEFGISPNLAATFTYSLLDKKCSSRTKLRDLLTTGVQLFFTKDPFLVAAALADRRLLIGVVALKAATTGYNAIKTVGSEVVLRKVNGRKKTKSEVRELLPQGGVVFAHVKEE